MTSRKLSTFFVLFLWLFTTFALAQDSGVVREISVRGNLKISTAAILAQMKSKVNMAFSQADLTQDEQSILEMGYFQDAKVLSRQISNNDWSLLVEVKENPVIKEVKITGNTAIKTEDILKVVQQPIGEIWNLRYNLPTADAISKLYEKSGYFAQADFQPIPESPNTLHIVIRERAVNKIEISGLHRTQESVIRKLLKTKPGQAFSEEKWAIDRRRLDSTQWFEELEASSRDTGDIGKFDLLLRLKEARTSILGLGLALDPRSRLAGGIRYSDTNFRGSGQTVAVNLQQDTAGSGLSAGVDYQNPWLDSKDTAMTVRVYSQINSYFSGSGFGGSVAPTGDERFDERRSGGAFSLARPIGKIYTGAIGFSYESINTLNLKTTGTNFVQQDGTLGKFNVTLARDTRDVPLDPAEGSLTRLMIEPGFSHVSKIGGQLGSNPELLGNHGFVRTQLEYKQFWSKRPKDPKKLADPRQVLALRSKFGVISGQVPFFEQFFAGGSDSLRGYSDQRFWGKQTFLTTIEYRVPIQKSFNLIGFADYGGAWGGYGSINSFTQSNSVNFKLGYGAGIGFRTPLGLIRIDFGLNSQGGSKTHISIGGAF